MNSSYTYDDTETNKEVLASLKMILTLPRAKSPPGLIFLDKSHTATFLSLLSKKHY